MNKSYFLWPLGLLAALITFLGLTAQPPSSAVEPATSTKQADVTEQRLELSTGKVVVCLLFPTTPPAVSCDWR